MKKEKYGFVYIWYDRKHKRYYIGSHWGTENDSYICSSRWMRKSYRRRPEDFKRRILTNNILDRKETLIKEFEWLSLIKKEELGKKYYNLRNIAFDHWSTDENSLKTIGEKISIANTNNPKRLWSEEQKLKASERMKGENNPFFGKTHTEEFKEKNSLLKKGCKFPNRKKIELSEEHKENIRNSIKKTLAEKYPLENRYIPEFEKGTKEWKEKISKTRSQYMWITNEEIDKLILKNEIIEEGWRKGRKSRSFHI